MTSHMILDATLTILVGNSELPSYQNPCLYKQGQHAFSTANTYTVICLYVERAEHQHSYCGCIILICLWPERDEQNVWRRWYFIIRNVEIYYLCVNNFLIIQHITAIQVPLCRYLESTCTFHSCITLWRTPSHFVCYWLLWF